MQLRNNVIMVVMVVMVLVWFILINCSTLQILIPCVFFLGGAVNGDFHGVIIADTVSLFMLICPFLDLCKCNTFPGLSPISLNIFNPLSMW